MLTSIGPVRTECLQQDLFMISLLSLFLLHLDSSCHHSRFTVHHCLVAFLQTFPKAFCKCLRTCFYVYRAFTTCGLSRAEVLEGHGRSWVTDVNKFSHECPWEASGYVLFEHGGLSGPWRRPITISCLPRRIRFPFQQRRASVMSTLGQLCQTFSVLSGPRLKVPHEIAHGQNRLLRRHVLRPCEITRVPRTFQACFSVKP